MYCAANMGGNVCSSELVMRSWRKCRNFIEQVDKNVLETNNESRENKGTNKFDDVQTDNSDK